MKHGRIPLAAMVTSVLLLARGVSHAMAPANGPTPPAPAPPVTVHWLDGSAPAVPQGVTFGVPWPAGAVAKATPLRLTDDAGQPIASTTWPLAYWPDGSVKWSAIATTARPEERGPFAVAPGDSPVPSVPLQVAQSDRSITITSGHTVWQLAKTGSDLVEAISIDGRVVARSGRLIVLDEDRGQWGDMQGALRVWKYTSDIESATVESAGPVRVVVKITGHHKADGFDRTWLPFVVRLYFYAGSDAVRMMHTFVFDGKQQIDFIRGIGVRFDVPMREQFQNRDVRLAGDSGFFAEPVQLTSIRRPMPDGIEAKQIAGQRIPNLDQLPHGELVRQMAVWNDYKLTQLSPDGYTIEKRTNPGCAWIRALNGKRSTGMAFVGDVSGGLSVDLRNFWQLWPTAMEITNAGTDAATLTCWLWSPDAPAMDLRPYDVKAHGLEAAYEDVQPGMSQPYGIARTSELTLRPWSAVPGDDALLKQNQADQQPAMLVCSPRYYHQLAVFGQWSLPDRSTPPKAEIEALLDNAIAFYEGQVEERRWYGFWDFGDVMHTYDTPRHEWKYDVGGYAWANTELMPNLWLWYSFLRSGRADVFRMAEAMTRQSQECDVYHLGEWKGLGSRHNVRHWGDGAKELRISQCELKRIYYYLTADERTGDLMDEEVDADAALLKVDPLRELPGMAAEKSAPTHLRIGPDWLALVSNWYTAWERTGDKKYLQRIKTGMASIEALPRGIATEQNFGYDPATKKLSTIPDPAAQAGSTPSLLPLFGGPELNTEIIPVLDDPAWKAAWLAYCKRGGGRIFYYARMPAYAAYLTHDPKLAARAWQQFLHGPEANFGPDRFTPHLVSGAVVAAPVDEINGVSTNDTSQWCLNAIELLQLVGNQIPAGDPAFSPHPVSTTRGQAR